MGNVLEDVDPMAASAFLSPPVPWPEQQGRLLCAGLSQGGCSHCVPTHWGFLLLSESMRNAHGSAAAKG